MSVFVFFFLTGSVRNLCFLKNLIYTFKTSRTVTPQSNFIKHIHMKYTKKLLSLHLFSSLHIQSNICTYMNILFPKMQKQGVLAAKEIANVKCFHYFQKQEQI